VKQSQLIAKNILASGGATAIAGVLQLAIIIIVARNVSVADFGAYSFMLAFSFVIFRIADGGLSIILTRDLAIEPAKIPEVLGATLGLAWVMSFVAIVLMAATIPFFHFTREISLLVALMGIEGLTQFICGCWGAVQRSQEDYENNALGFVLHKVVALTIVSAAMILRYGLAGVVAAHMTGSLVQWWFYRWKVIRVHGRARMRFDLGAWKYLIRESVPVGAANAVRILAEQADIIILTLMAGATAVGLFSGPFKIAAGLRFLPQALVLPLIPLYSRAAVSDGARETFREAYERSIKTFMLMGLPFAILFALSPGVLTVGFLGGSYRAATPAMQLLSVGLWLVFLTTPFPFLLTALGRQRFLFVTSTGAFVARIALDFIFVRYFNFLGPCIALMISESLVLAAWIGGVWEAGFKLNFLAILWPPAVASIAMGAVLYLAHPQSLLTLAPVALVGGVIYLFVVIKLGGVSSTEMGLLRESADFLRPWLAQRFGQLRGKAL
jgi:O-antigen/teichoic acid export membrane protein